MGIKAQVQVGNTTFFVEGENAKSLFETISEVNETYGYDTCGACKSNEVVPLMRKVEKFKYYQITCRKCSAALALGQKEDNTLFPKRKNKAGDYLPNGGWVKWQDMVDEDDEDRPKVAPKNKK